MVHSRHTKNAFLTQHSLANGSHDRFENEDVFAYSQKHKNSPVQNEVKTKEFLASVQSEISVP